MENGRPLESSNPPAIETSDLTRRYGELTAVDRLNLVVAQGTIFGLLGPNGAGKTTVIKMLTTLLRPSAGTARVAGFDVLAAPRAVRRRIGYVPQLLSADGALSGVENLRLSAVLYGVPAAEVRTRVDEALALHGPGGGGAAAGANLFGRHDPPPRAGPGDAAPPGGVVSG